MTRTPYISGDTATFVWHGPAAPLLLGDFNRWDDSRSVILEKDGTGTWSAELHLPEDAYIEYAFRLDGDHLVDPGNPRKVFNGINKHNNYFYMPAAVPTSLARRQGDVPRGTVTEHSLPAFPWPGQSGTAASLQRRRLTLYQPAGEGPFPLLLVYDGRDYLRQGSLLTILDNLIHQGRIRPLAVALLANGGPLRYIEYNCSDATLDLVYNRLLPFARQHLDLHDINANPGAFGVMGASLGGLMAMYTALRMPQIFGNVLSQSGAFYPRSVLLDLVKMQERLPLDIWMDVGRLEWLLGMNESFRELLDSHGYPVTYRVYSGGHNYTAWRDHHSLGLESIFTKL